MTFRIVFIIAAAFLLASGRADAADSSYTTIDYERDCAELPSPEPGVIDERQCSGPGGLTFKWVNAPDASWIEFGTEWQDLRLGSFFAVNNTIEWRGAAAIVRYYTGANVGNLGTSSLVIYRVTAPACAVAVIPGATPNANLAAREAADLAGKMGCL